MLFSPPNCKIPLGYKNHTLGRDLLKEEICKCAGIRGASAVVWQCVGSGSGELL